VYSIDRQDPRFAVIDPACFASKNLYNAALYILRQSFFKHETVPTYAKLAHTLKDTPEFRALPAKVAQWVVRQVCGAWDTFWKAHSAYQQCPGKFTGRPKLPHYKPKLNGRNLLVYTRQAISQPALKEGRICPSQLNMVIQTKHKEVQQVRIVPHASHYVVEVIYTVIPLSPTQNALNPAWAASLDLGIDILAAVTSNKAGMTPFLVNGRPLKSVNAYYNKLKADLQALLLKGTLHLSSSHGSDQQAQPQDQALSALGQPVHCGLDGVRTAWYLDHRTQQGLETKCADRQGQQPELRYHSPFNLHPHADLQGPTGRHQGDRPRRRVYFQMLLPGSGAHPQACPVLRSTGQARRICLSPGFTDPG
jgi:hypothetical protein